MSEVDVKRVQARLLEMGKSIANILEKHDIPYMLAYGTLLGAVRHKGFIPWDDDFDLYLFDDTYDQAMEYLREELPEDMFLEDAKSEPLYFHAWAHVKDLYTEAYSEAYPHDSSYAHKGISVDLYRIKELPECELDTYLNDENRNYIERRKKHGLITEEDYKRRLYNLQLDEEKCSEQIENNKNNVFGFVSPYRCKKMEIADVHPLSKYTFENVVFWGPNHAEVILQNIYGDYMQLPPIEKRKGHYSYVDFLKEEMK